MRYVLIFLLFASVPSSAQLKTIKSFKPDNKVVAVSVDRPGDFYFVLKDGVIQHYSKDGKKIASTPPQKNLPTFFDARDGSRLFAYYGSESKYQYLNPQLEVVNELKLDSSFAIHPVLLCPSGDHELWILDTADFSLKRTVLMGTSIKFESDMKPSRRNAHFTAMREYQNFLFLLDEKSGISIFNGMGNEIKTIGGAGIHNFNFIGEELYYIQDNKLKFFDLFSAEVREESLPYPCDFVLLTDERRMLIHDSSVTIEEIKH